MTSIFWFALVLGGGLLLLSVLGDIFGDAADGFGEAGAELDVEGGSLDADLSGGYWHAFFSLRSLTYFLFAFGATGVLLDLAWDGAYRMIAWAASIGAGVLAGGFNALLIGYIRRTDSGRMAGDATLIGLKGQVVLPLSAEGTGKIEVTRGGRMHTLLARPFEREPTVPEEWRRVVVVEMRDGVALVVPFDDVDAPLLGPASDSEVAGELGSGS